jgi:hypothetical protein
MTECYERGVKIVQLKSPSGRKIYLTTSTDTKEKELPTCGLLVEKKYSNPTCRFPEMNYNNCPLAIAISLE